MRLGEEQCVHPMIRYFNRVRAAAAYVRLVKPVWRNVDCKDAPIPLGASVVLPNVVLGEDVVDRSINDQRVGVVVVPVWKRADEIHAPHEFIPAAQGHWHRSDSLFEVVKLAHNVGRRWFERSSALGVLESVSASLQLRYEDHDVRSRTPHRLGDNRGGVRECRFVFPDPSA